MSKQIKPKSEEKVTPMMEQYHKIKADYKDYLLFYQMGDFFEMFYEDAKVASQILNITLTSRGLKNDGTKIPMCGIPLKSYRAYLSRLIQAGCKVAICEQVEDPSIAKARGSKSVVKRDIVRLVTSGTLTEEELLEANQNNYILCIAEYKRKICCAWLDLSTGSFFVQRVKEKDLSTSLMIINPSEILISEKFVQKTELYDLFQRWNNSITTIADSKFSYTFANKTLCSFYNVNQLDGLGTYDNSEVISSAVVIDYVQMTQCYSKMKLGIPKIVDSDVYLQIDEATRRSLELTLAQSGSRKGSLLSLIDKTKTSTGGRLLNHDLVNPLKDINIINERLDGVEYFFTKLELIDRVTEILIKIPDMERALGRLNLRRLNPQDLQLIVFGLKNSLNLKETVKESLLSEECNILRGLINKIKDHYSLVELLERALKADNLPNNISNGGYIASGYSSALDKVSNDSSEVKRLLKELEVDLISKTGAKLKIATNNVWGYYIEVPSRQAHLLADLADFKHRQTMSNSVRFTSDSLSELELQINQAQESIVAIELEIFEDLVNQVFECSGDILDVVAAISRIDVLCSHARLSLEDDYVKPKVCDDISFEVVGGRHPIVESVLNSNGESFIANDCILEGGEKTWLLTGPNMAGKSTFLRQNALIAILAQIGCYVPAQSARIGVTDKLFSRVGANDNISQGKSTFMVEMIETATIVNRATERSLVILDEIGRGTSTYDGLSIAWAVIEHICMVNNSRCLFATHYHELVELKGKLKNLEIYNVDVKEWDKKIIFLHTISKGASERSYGIHVASLAGIPSLVIRRAKEILAMIESKRQAGDVKILIDALPLFSQIESTEVSSSDDILDKKELNGALDVEHSGVDPILLDIYGKLRELDVNDMSPKQAWDVLFEFTESLK